MATLKTIENGNYNDLMRKLTALKSFDKDIEAKRKSRGGLAILSGITGFISAFIIGIFPPILILAAICGVVFAISLALYISSVRQDLDNRRLDTAYRFVEMLGQDVAPGRSMALFIDFGDYRKAGKLISKTGGMFGQKEFSYEHLWMKCGGILCDGNKFEIEVTKCVKRKEKPKRKYTKVKERIVEKAEFSIRLNPEIYPKPEQVAGLVKTGLMPHGITVSRAIGSDKAIKICAVTPAAILANSRSGKSGDESNLFNGDKLLGIVIDAYSGIRNSRPDTAAQSEV